MGTNIVHEQWEDFNDCLPGISISHQPQQGGNTLRPHWHERMELWRVTEGQMSIMCEREAFTARAGDVVVFNPFEVHTCHIDTDDSAIDCFIVDLNMLAGGLQGKIEQYLSEILCGSIRFCHLIRNHPAIWEALGRGTDLARSEQDARCLALSGLGLMLSVFGLLCSHYIFIRSEHARSKTDDMSVILNYIYSHYDQRLTLENMAAQLCFSKSYFCRWFKQKTGESPMDYLNTVRVQRAHELLIGTDLSIGEVCYQTGFSDINGLNRQFKKHLSVSPSRVRKARLA